MPRRKNAGREKDRFCAWLERCAGLPEGWLCYAEDYEEPDELTDTILYGVLMSECLEKGYVYDEYDDQSTAGEDEPEADEEEFVEESEEGESEEDARDVFCDWLNDVILSSEDDEELIEDLERACIGE